MVFNNDFERLQYAVKDFTIERQEILNKYAAVPIFILSLESYKVRGTDLDFNRIVSNWNCFAQTHIASNGKIFGKIGQFFSLPNIERDYWIDKQKFDENPDDLYLVNQYNRNSESNYKTPIILTFDFTTFYQLDNVLISSDCCEYELSLYNE